MAAMTENNLVVIAFIFRRGLIYVVYCQRACITCAATCTCAVSFYEEKLIGLRHMGVPNVKLRSSVGRVEWNEAQRYRDAGLLDAVSTPNLESVARCLKS